MVRKSLLSNVYRNIEKIFCFQEVPDHIMNNVSDVIRQIQVIPKRIEDYTQEEIDNFPKLFDW